MITPKHRQPDDLLEKMSNVSMEPAASSQHILNAPKKVRPDASDEQLEELPPIEQNTKKFNMADRKSRQFSFIGQLAENLRTKAHLTKL